MDAEKYLRYWDIAKGSEFEGFKFAFAKFLILPNCFAKNLCKLFAFTLWQILLKLKAGR